MVNGGIYIIIMYVRHPCKKVRDAKRREGWCIAHTGKWVRRKLHKAIRAYNKGHGRERSVVHWSREVNWKLS
jgi:hypothetical protein